MTWQAERKVEAATVMSLRPAFIEATSAPVTGKVQKIRRQTVAVELDRRP